MLGLTPLGIVHTAISLVAVVAGIRAVLRHREITLTSGVGRTYVIATFLTAATGLGIFAHGGFGPPHVLSLLTLAALAVGTVAATRPLFGRASRTVQAIAYSTTLLFHAIPGFTETLTRLPPGNPLLPNAEAPAFGPIYGTLLLLYIVGLTLQLRWLRSQPAAA